ncbi:alpha,alpha-trehalase nth1 [Trifolium repens]|nr:alpha,alpha-trehalase nth1 [Trifolium repens]
MGQFNKCPANWENVLEGIRKISYSDHDTTRDWEDDDDDILSPKDRRFAVLASSLLSSQTKEHVTRGKHIYLLIFMLLETFFLVGFYIRKASVGPKIAHLVMIIAWNNVQGPDMCRYSCPPHLQSSWMGFEIRHKTENFNTRRNKKGAGTMVASEGRMGSNKSSFGTPEVAEAEFNGCDDILTTGSVPAVVPPIDVHSPVNSHNLFPLSRSPPRSRVTNHLSPNLEQICDVNQMHQLNDLLFSLQILSTNILMLLGKTDRKTEQRCVVLRVILKV